MVNGEVSRRELSHPGNVRRNNPSQCYLFSYLEAFNCDAVLIKGIIFFNKGFTFHFLRGLWHTQTNLLILSTIKITNLSTIKSTVSAYVRTRT